MSRQGMKKVSPAFSKAAGVQGAAPLALERSSKKIEEKPGASRRFSQQSTNRSPRLKKNQRKKSQDARLLPLNFYSVLNQTPPLRLRLRHRQGLRPWTPAGGASPPAPRQLAYSLACFFRQASSTAQNTRDSSVSSAAADREVSAMGTRAPTTAPQVMAWA